MRQWTNENKNRYNHIKLKCRTVWCMWVIKSQEKNIYIRENLIQRTRKIRIRKKAANEPEMHRRRHRNRVVNGELPPTKSKRKSVFSFFSLHFVQTANGRWLNSLCVRTPRIRRVRLYVCVPVHDGGRCLSAMAWCVLVARENLHPAQWLAIVVLCIIYVACSRCLLPTAQTFVSLLVNCNEEKKHNFFLSILHAPHENGRNCICALAITLAIPFRCCFSECFRHDRVRGPYVQSICVSIHKHFRRSSQPTMRD